MKSFLNKFFFVCFENRDLLFFCFFHLKMNLNIERKYVGMYSDLNTQSKFGKQIA